MATIQIKNVPAETHAVLRRRAANAGQSLQEYMLARFVEDARHPTINEWLDEVEANPPIRSKITMSDIVEAIHAEREERESRA